MITFPRGRNLVLGVGAGIAAYKACDLLRRLQDNGFVVDVVPTPSSLNFVGKATWEALSGREVRTEVWEGSASVSHVSLAEKSDLIVIAPATADLISRLASGRADDLLTATVLASSAPVLLVPAMHPGMWLNPATEGNVKTLKARGVVVLEPDTGRLTGTDSGIGRFPETSRIIGAVQDISGTHGSLVGRKVLVTAGGTIEPIDAVRFIGNRSSGRQGVAIAYQALREGAEVTLIAGSTEEFELPGVNLIKTPSAREMLRALKENIEESDALVMSAAVADARPAQQANGKISKSELGVLQLVENPDLLAELSANKRDDQVFVGFAAETERNLIDRGMRKLHKKGVDLLYVTDVADGRVFGEELTSGSLLSKRGMRWDFSEVNKLEVAEKIVTEIATELGVRNG
jgi:phosphopantothenoylcysteine decarboxylase/phosphopantothenate--cysteine ligase